MNLNEQEAQPLELEYRTIQLTQGQSCKVDIADYEWLSKWKWCALWMPSSKSFYAVRSSPRDEDYKQKRITMAREIMQAPKGILVDHEDHDTLNNRRYNLRLSTHSQNGCNRRRNEVSSSGFKGVSWRASENKWRASIKIKGKRVELGCFGDRAAAREAYVRAANGLHGEFAYTGDAVSVAPIFATRVREGVDC